MGATDFVTTIWTESNMASAYNELVADSHSEFGYDPYNGTISTTGGGRAVTSTPMTSNGAQSFASWAMDHCDDSSGRRSRYAASKWEEALAIPILSDDAFTLSKSTFTLTQDALGDAALDSGESTRWRFRSAALDRAVREHGHSVHSVDIDVTEKFGVIVGHQKGKSRTVYEVTGASNHPARFDTKAQAVAAAKKALLNPGRPWSSAVDVRAVKCYGTGDEENAPADPTVAVQLRRVVKSAKARVTVTVATPKKRVPAEAKRGWLFYGIAAT